MCFKDSKSTISSILKDFASSNPFQIKASKPSAVSTEAKLPGDLPKNDEAGDLEIWRSKDLDLKLIEPFFSPKKIPQMTAILTSIPYICKHQLFLNNSSVERYWLRVQGFAMSSQAVPRFLEDKLVSNQTSVNNGMSRNAVWSFELTPCLCCERFLERCLFLLLGVHIRCMTAAWRSNFHMLQTEFSIMKLTSSCGNEDAFAQSSTISYPSCFLFSMPLLGT